MGHPHETYGRAGRVFCTLVALVSLTKSQPVQLIVDTDLGFDVDDVGALAVANHLTDVSSPRS